MKESDFLQHGPGANQRPIQILAAWVPQPDSSLLCQPLPAVCVSTTNVACRVSRVQNHRPEEQQLDRER